LTHKQPFCTVIFTAQVARFLVSLLRRPPSELPEAEAEAKEDPFIL